MRHAKSPLSYDTSGWVTWRRTRKRVSGPPWPPAAGQHYTQDAATSARAPSFISPHRSRPFPPHHPQCPAHIHTQDASPALISPRRNADPFKRGQVARGAVLAQQASHQAQHIHGYVHEARRGRARGGGEGKVEEGVQDDGAGGGGAAPAGRGGSHFI